MKGEVPTKALTSSLLNLFISNDIRTSVVSFSFLALCYKPFIGEYGQFLISSKTHLHLVGKEDKSSIVLFSHAKNVFMLMSFVFLFLLFFTLNSLCDFSL